MYLISGWNVQAMCIGQESQNHHEQKWLFPEFRRQNWSTCRGSAALSIFRFEASGSSGCGGWCMAQCVGTVGLRLRFQRWGCVLHGIWWQFSRFDEVGIFVATALAHLAYDEIMEAASVSYNCLLKFCQSSKKRKHEDTEVEMVTDTAAEVGNVGDVGPAETVEVLQRGGEDVAPLAMDKIGVQFL